MTGFFMALSFLTITPWISSLRGTEKDMVRSLYFYPVVGALLGLVLSGISILGEYIDLGLAGSALVVVAWLVLTGGLHADGLMDACDGLFSAKDREKRLEIMRDSRVGAMGVIALAAVLLLKVSFLDALPAGIGIAALVLVPAVARLAMVWAVVRYPYARSTPGLGKCFGPNPRAYTFWCGLAAIAILAYLLAGELLLLLVLVSLLTSMVIAAVVANRLGGHTGDTYGFLCEITETMALIIVVIGVELFRVW